MVQRGGDPAPPESGRRRRAIVLLAAAVVGLVAAQDEVRVRPNDPIFPNQWHLENTGQPYGQGGVGPVDTGPGEPGTPGADIDATRAWALSTGSRDVVVAVLDNDLDWDAEDLAANVWVNPGGVNGCPAGSHGYHIPTGACEPHDQEGHGTDMAWLIGAVGENGQALAGVNWQTSIMGVSLYRDRHDNAFVAGLDWIIGARQAGVNVRVINFSAGWVRDSPQVRDAIVRAGEHDILLITAAGNSGDDNDVTDDYPCNFDLWNVICVAASDRDDNLVWGSSYGDETVHLAAPGTSICATPYQSDCGGDSPGTSWSTAITSGAAALVWAHEPHLTARQVKARLLGNVDPTPGLQGKVITGGRLNVYRAMIDDVGATATPEPTPTSTPPTPPPTANPTADPTPTADPPPGADPRADPPRTSTPSADPSPSADSTAASPSETLPPTAEAAPGPPAGSPGRSVPGWAWLAVLAVLAMAGLAVLGARDQQP